VRRALCAAIVIACTCAATSPSSAQTPSPPQTGTAAKPTEAECRVYLNEGDALRQQKAFDKARERLHAGWRACANPLSLILIARTYEEQGDLPHALAYIEQFLVVAGQAHELRAEMEQAAASLRQRVPAAQRVSIAAELAANTPPANTPPANTPPANTPPANTPPANTPPANTPPANQPPVNLRNRLDKQVESFDWKPTAGARDSVQTVERTRGLFLGANVSYAAMGKLEIATPTMTGRSDFAAAYAVELQAGYRILPYFSVALAPQMFFNLHPGEEATAREVELFVEATGHIVLQPRWDLDVFLAPGYSVLLVPDADDATGLAFRWGGGPMFYIGKHLSFGAELSQQLGFQRTERAAGDVDMKTSFVTLLAGIRIRQ
jgi:hypothetical protein